MEDDHLGARRLRDPGRVVEHPDRHVQLLAALGVAHEARRSARAPTATMSLLARELAEALGELVVHPEAALEVDLAGREVRARAAPRPPPPGSRATARAPGRSGASAAICTRQAYVRPALYARAMSDTPDTHRSARARHRPPAHRPLARGRRHRGVVARGRRRVHARRVRQGLLRRAHRGASRLALRRPRLPRARAQARRSGTSADAVTNLERLHRTSSPSRRG